MAVIENIADQEIGEEARALFEEARRRRRRRRGFVAGAITLALLAVVGGIRVAGSGGNGSRPSGKGSDSGPADRRPGKGSATGDRAVTIVGLPPGDWINAVSRRGTKLLLTGTVAGADRSGSGSAGRCMAVLVNPRSLAWGTVTEGSCNDPALSGEQVAPVVSTAADGTSTVQVARHERAATSFTTGPVVMTFSEASDTHLVTAYGDGSMWLYDVDTTNGPEVLQISEATGAVTDTASVPELYRPIVAANDDGLWLGNSVEGSSVSSPLWHIAPETTSAVAVAGPPASETSYKSGVGLRSYGVDVSWIVGSGNHLWAGLSIPGNRAQTIWRFDGPSGRAVFSAADHGYDPTAVVGDEANGLWTAVPYPAMDGPIRHSQTGSWTAPGQNRQQNIVEINPDTGRETVESRIDPEPTLNAEEGVIAGQSVFLDGAFFILQPPFRANGYLGYSHLVRVRG